MPTLTVSGLGSCARDANGKQDKIERNTAKISVIEVKDPAPINPERKASNEAKNRQPLGFGSRVDVGTGGNWE